MDQIDLSVVIATRNRSDMLRSTLEHFCRLDVVGLNWEILIVDNGSTDSTQKVLSEAAGRLPLVCFIYPGAGKHRALNHVIDRARGALLLFTDDDVVPNPNWLQHLVRAAKSWPQAAVFGGPIIPAFPQSTPDWISDPGFLYASRAYGRLDLGQDEGYVEPKFFGANLMVRATALGRIRFDETLGPADGNYIQGGEAQLIDRICRQGDRCVYVPGAEVLHVVSPEQVTVDWLLGRAYRYGRGMARIEIESTDGVFRPVLEWLRLARAGVRAGLHRYSSDPVRFAAAHRYHLLRGKCRERRAIIRERTEVCRNTV